MPIRYVERGNLFESGADMLVNPVNCLGAAGKGLAAKFRRLFPGNYDLYKEACDLGRVRIGQMFITNTGLEQPRFIANFPTKFDWRKDSQLEWVEQGLRELAQDAVYLGVSSVAIPALGAGEGRLDWGDVWPLIWKYFEGFQEIEVIVYGPQ